MDILNKTYNIQILIGSENQKKVKNIFIIRIAKHQKNTSIRNNINSLIRTNAIRLLQYL
jgi:hypothetical protein